MSFDKWEEKRRHKRYASELKARYRPLKNAAAGYGEGLITNVSGGGMFIHTSEPLAVGIELQLHVDVVTPFGEDEQIDAQARVVWITHKKDEEGMGLQFTQIDQHAKYAILACAHRGTE